MVHFGSCKFVCIGTVLNIIMSPSEMRRWFQENTKQTLFFFLRAVVTTRWAHALWKIDVRRLLFTANLYGWKVNVFLSIQMWHPAKQPGSRILINKLGLAVSPTVQSLTLAFHDMTDSSKRLYSLWDEDWYYSAEECQSFCGIGACFWGGLMRDREAMTLSDSMCDEGFETPAGGRCHFSTVTRKRLTAAFFDNYMGCSLSVGSVPLFLPTLSLSLSLSRHVCVQSVTGRKSPLSSV